MKNMIKIRAILSSLLIIMSIIVLLSGIELHRLIELQEKLALGSAFLFFSRDLLVEIHTLSGFIVSGLVIMHFFINYKMFISEVKYLFKKG